MTTHLLNTKICNINNKKLSLKLYNTCISVLQNFGIFFRPPPKLPNFAKFRRNFAEILNPGWHNKFRVFLMPHSYLLSATYPHSLMGFVLQASQAHSGPAILTLRIFFLPGLLGLGAADGSPGCGLLTSTPPHG